MVCWHIMIWCQIKDIMDLIIANNKITFYWESENIYYHFSGRFKFASMSPGGMIYCILYIFQKGMEEPPLASININQFYLWSDDTPARPSIKWVTPSQPCSQGHVCWCCGDPTPSESSATQSKWWKDTCHDLALRHVHAYSQHDLFSLLIRMFCT